MEYTHVHREIYLKIPGLYSSPASHLSPPMELYIESHSSGGLGPMAETPHMGVLGENLLGVK